jgi:hypothetical protein
MARTVSISVRHGDRTYTLSLSYFKGKAYFLFPFGHFRSSAVFSSVKELVGKKRFRLFFTRLHFQSIENVS